MQPKKQTASSKPTSAKVTTKESVDTAKFAPISKASEIKPEPKTHRPQTSIGSKPLSSPNIPPTAQLKPKAPRAPETVAAPTQASKLGSSQLSQKMATKPPASKQNSTAIPNSRPIDPSNPWAYTPTASRLPPPPKQHRPYPFLSSKKDDDYEVVTELLHTHSACSSMFLKKIMRQKIAEASELLHWRTDAKELRKVLEGVENFLVSQPDFLAQQESSCWSR